MWPSWSRDGKWIYFRSNRSGSYQVWKLPAEQTAAPEEAVQATRNGGGGPVESHDGKLVYYLKREATRGSVWQVPVEGGEETQMIESTHRYPGCFAVVEKGIYFISDDGAELRFFDFNTQAIRTIAALERTPTNVADLAVSPDGRTILYTQLESAGSDLMLVENFR